MTSFKPKRKPNKFMIVGLFGVILVVGGALAYAVIMANPSTDGSSNLTPARSLAGTWKPSFATTFNIKTDFNTATLEDVGSEQRNVVFKITETSDPNTVKVEVDYTIASRNIQSGSGYVPDVSPIFYDGYINGSQLTIQGSNGVVGVFSYTSTTMTGTWVTAGRSHTLKRSIPRPTVLF